MKKSNRKLVLRSETIRELSAQALTRIIGGQEAVPFSRDKECLAAAVPHSGDKVCLTA